MHTNVFILYTYKRVSFKFMNSKCVCFVVGIYNPYLLILKKNNKFLCHQYNQKTLTNNTSLFDPKHSWFKNDGNMTMHNLNKVQKQKLKLEFMEVYTSPFSLVQGSSTYSWALLYACDFFLTWKIMSFLSLSILRSHSLQCGHIVVFALYKHNF